MISTKEAAEILGLSLRGVQKMIEEGRLKAVRIGRDNLIVRGDLEDIKRKSKAGRPPNSKMNQK